MTNPNAPATTGGLLPEDIRQLAREGVAQFLEADGEWTTGYVARTRNGECDRSDKIQCWELGYRAALTHPTATPAPAGNIGIPITGTTADDGFDPDAATGCADDFLPGSAGDWRDAITPAPAGELVERDIYEVANQLLGYVDVSTPPDLADFLIREGNAAAALAEAIAAKDKRITELEALVKVQGEVLGEWLECPHEGPATEPGDNSLIERTRALVGAS